MRLTTYLSTIEKKGYLKYEYNPFHNYQTNVDLYQVETNIGTLFIPDGKAIHIKTGKILTEKEPNKWVDDNGNIYKNDIITTTDKTLFARAGSLIDFNTNKLNFDLEHPVDIQIQPSYDGSVNLILNDDKNIPRLINSRFSHREKDTYEIVDRIGENDTNIYNSNDFDKDTSLYFRYSTSPKVEFMRHISGTLGVGQYCFYFTYCDSDNNESDIIAETGLIPTFIGNDKDPFSIDGGIKNQNSNKGISIRLSGLDKSYNYIKVYQFRYFADYQQNRVYECKKLYHKYPVNSSMFILNVTGNEDGEMIDPNILNLSSFNPNHVLTQAQCKNMLFFGNIVKNIDNYKELTDCALRIIPEIISKPLIDINSKYESVNNNFSYYDVNNIYNLTGYFPEEYYRFGVVFIYSNGTLSNVYNTLGYRFDQSAPTYINGNLYNTNGDVLQRKYIEYDSDGWIYDSGVYQNLPPYSNAKGVLKLDINTSNNNTVIGIKFKISEEVVNHLKNDLNIVGMFFVRQKRIPTIISQFYLMPIDKILQAPIIEVGNKKYQVESFLSQSSDISLTQDYVSRLIKYNTHVNISTNAYAAICPDFLLNQPYYNQVFNGSNFRIKQITSNTKLYQDQNERDYYMNMEPNNNLTFQSNSIKKDVKICTVTEDVPTVAIKKQIYRLNIGEAEQAWRFRFAEIDKSEDKEYSNLIRGIYSPYLAIYSDNELETGCLYNVYLEKESNFRQEFEDRMNSKEPFYAISDRYNFEDLEGSEEKSLICFRGDCYNNTFTYRLNRNFQDPTLPNNDEIIKDNELTFKNNYFKDKTSDQETTNYENWTKINRSDVNAIKLGSWITIKVKSSMNYALRSIDHSHVSEEAMMGSERSFYPKSSLKEAGENKKPDSYLYNDAYRATLGFKCYFTLNDVNYLKDTFSNRIQYSAISIQDSYKNNYRESLSTYFRDYSQEYGSIQKLVGFEGYLLVVFEHAVALAVINERILAGGSDGEPVFINTHNVLPEELTVISDTYGTIWPESVVKSEAGYVYGVDTVAKKIWRVQGQQIEILSDFKVGNFLNDNINLSEMDKTPIIGLRNVKTHYNNNKKDVMFTFYNNIYSDEEKAWNLCYNELLGEFVTFYSWIPSYSENIDTQFFSFDRDTSKILSLLNRCNFNIPENTGVLLDSPVFIINNNDDKNIEIPIKYRQISIGHAKKTEDGIIYNSGNVIDQNKTVKFQIENDHWGNNNFVTIDNTNSESKLKITRTYADLTNFFNNNKVMLLEITPYIENNNDKYYFPTETVAVRGYNNDITKFLKTDFYLHGNAGIINCQEQLYPTHWYGEFHPFEFEFVVNDKIGQQKIFTNLVLISNKAEPESFHFEIEGDNYEFSSDKRTMYFRQEATKNLYQNLGSDILYDRYFTDVIANKYTYEQYYRGDGISPYNSEQKNEYSKYKTNERFNWDRAYPVENSGLVKQVKSTIFPLYYNRVDTYNEIYHKYTSMNGGDFYDFKNLSGSEIVWNRVSNQFNIVTHIKNSPIDRVGRVRGNSRYKEGKWNIQIPSIQFCQSNEKEWVNIDDKIKEYGSPLRHFNDLKIPPIVINSDTIPSDLTNNTVQKGHLPNIYCDATDWKYTIKDQNQTWTARKETKIRDKWMKVRVRYSGKNLAVIHSIITLYNISYS